MLRKLSFLAKKEGMATRDFIDYYENHHVPLILSLAPAPPLYQRRYIVAGDELNLREDDVDFDVVTEMGFTDRAAYREWSTILEPARDVIAADEARFLDRSRSRSCVVSEHVS